MDRIGNVVPQARQVCEAKINHFDIIGCCKLQHGLRIHIPSIKEFFPGYQEYLCMSIIKRSVNISFPLNLVKPLWKPHF